MRGTAEIRRRDITDVDCIIIISGAVSFRKQKVILIYAQIVEASRRGVEIIALRLNLTRKVEDQETPHKQQCCFRHGVKIRL